MGGASGGSHASVRYTPPDPIERERKLLEETRKQRDIDLAQGRQRGAELFSLGTLGSVEEKRAKEIEDIIGRRKAQAEGMTPDEKAELTSLTKQSKQQQLLRDQAGALRSLRSAQASSGVRGATASAQQQRLLSKAQEAQIGSEREMNKDIFSQNLALRRQGTDALQAAVEKARADELARQQYNMEQRSRERLGQLSTELGYGSLGATERGAVQSRLAGEEAAKAMGGRQSSGGKGGGGK